MKLDPEPAREPPDEEPEPEEPDPVDPDPEDPEPENPEDPEPGLETGELPINLEPTAVVVVVVKGSPGPNEPNGPNCLSFIIKLRFIEV